MSGGESGPMCPTRAASKPRSLVSIVVWSDLICSVLAGSNPHSDGDHGSGLSDGTAKCFTCSASFFSLAVVVWPLLQRPQTRKKKNHTPKANGNPQDWPTLFCTLSHYGQWPLCKHLTHDTVANWTTNGKQSEITEQITNHTKNVVTKKNPRPIINKRRRGAAAAQRPRRTWRRPHGFLPSPVDLLPPPPPLSPTNPVV